jgi:hypothetical protein
VFPHTVLTPLVRRGVAFSPQCVIPPYGFDPGFLCLLAFIRAQEPRDRMARRPKAFWSCGWCNPLQNNSHQLQRNSNITAIEFEQLQLSQRLYSRFCVYNRSSSAVTCSALTVLQTVNTNIDNRVSCCLSCTCMISLSYGVHIRCRLAEAVSGAYLNVRSGISVRACAACLPHTPAPVS